MIDDDNRSRILIVDDDPISRRFLRKMLEEFWKGEILVADDGQSAWETLQRNFAPLVIADWVMPRMDGTELCRKIRTAVFERYVYFILLTARDDQCDVLEGLQAGADDYVRKPFNPRELRLRINAARRVIKLEEALAEKNAELVRLNTRLEELARIDPLMQIGNRHSFYESIERIHNQFIRYGQTYALLMCDVDFFKQYNDTFGHQAGDVVLQRIAAVIQGMIRQADQAFRYGGEEIVILLPAQDVEGAVVLGERLCQRVRELDIPHPHGLDGKLSISVGATACNAINPVSNWKDLLEQADQVLYRAKRGGRGQLCASAIPSAVSAPAP